MAQSVGDLNFRCHLNANRESDSVISLINIYNNSTDEEKKLLSKECKIHFECCCCGNFFLNHLDLLTHKRIYCHPIYSTAALSYSAVTPDFTEKAHTEPENDDHAKKERALSQQQNKGETGTSFDTKTDSQSPKRAKIILKRTNVIDVVNKHTKHCTLPQQNSEHKLELHTSPRISRDMTTTTFVEGQQIMESIPHALVDTIPPDRVFIPQDSSSRYREMSLDCNLKDDSSKNGIARKIESEELKILERIGKYQTMVVDLSSLSCSHSDCKEKQPFSSLFTFAYHLTVKHNRRATSNKRIPCYLCDFEFQ
ncbi:unnamed protein product, partial [Cercopithifilaria johnstoni]